MLKCKFKNILIFIAIPLQFCYKEICIVYDYNKSVLCARDHSKMVQQYCDCNILIISVNLEC